MRQVLGLDTTLTPELEPSADLVASGPVCTESGTLGQRAYGAVRRIVCALVGDALPDRYRPIRCLQRSAWSHTAYRERRTRSLGTARSRPFSKPPRAWNASHLTAWSSAIFRNSRLPGGRWSDCGATTNGGARSTVAPTLLDFDCIAVDECQDLTPIEALVLVELASHNRPPPAGAPVTGR